MKLPILFLSFVILMIVNCAKNDSTPPPSETVNLATIEQAASQEGVLISYDAPGNCRDFGGYSSATCTRIYIGLNSVGNTDAELHAAIKILRRYYSAIAASSSLDSHDIKQRLDSIERAMNVLQTKRDDLSKPHGDEHH